MKRQILHFWKLKHFRVMNLCFTLFILVSCSSSPEQNLPTRQDKKKVEIASTLDRQANTIAISIKDVKSDAKSFPFRTGIPFPKGVLKSIRNICLWNANKTKKIPVDAKLVSSWDDGSVRWIQLRFQSDIFKDNPKLDKVFLEYGENASQVKPISGISYVSEDGNLILDSGKLRVRFLKNGSILMDELFYDMNGDGKFQISEQVLDSKGVTHNMKVFFKNSSKIETLECVVKELELEERGNIQSTIKISGDYFLKGRAIAGFIIRCYFYEGKGFMRFDHVFTYKADPENEFVSDLNIRFNLKPEFINTAALGKKELKDIEVVALQDWWNNFKITGKDNKILEKGDKFRGCVSVLSKPKDDLRISFFVKDFWQKYPKAISVSKNFVEIGLWPGKLKRLLDLRRYSDTIYTEEPDFETNPKVVNRSAQGMSAHHQFFIDFSKISTPMKKVDGLSKVLFEPPVLAFSPEWLRKTDVFGDFYDEIPQKWPRLWNKMKLFSRWHKASQKQFGWYGMLDFGDWRSRYYQNHWTIYGRHGWACNSADPVFGLIFAYLIGGDVDSFRLAAESSSHYINVDVCHFADNTGRLFKNKPQVIGSSSRHGRQHWSGYLGSTNYVYPVGACQYYLFTGEERYRDVLSEIGKFLVSCGGTHGVFPGMQWIYEALMHEEKYKDLTTKLNKRIKICRDTICSAPKKVDARHPEGWPSKMNFSFRVSTDNMPGLLLYTRRNNDAEMMEHFPKMADMYLANYKHKVARKNMSYFPAFHLLLPYAAFLSTKERKYLDSFSECYSGYLPKRDINLNGRVSFEDLRAIEMDKAIGKTYRTYQDIWFLRSMPYIVACLSALGYDEKSYLEYTERLKGAQ